MSENQTTTSTRPEVIAELDQAQMPIIGARVRRARLRQGLSIRETAERAGVDKNAILRLERGKGTSIATLCKVGMALRESMNVLTMPEPPPEDRAAVHRAKDDKWWPPVQRNARFDAHTWFESLDLEERNRLAHERGDSFWEMLYISRLTNGKLRPSLQDLYGPTWKVSHTGEEFVLCLEGTAIVTVSGKEHRLEKGEAVAFWSSEEHNYAPAPECVERGDLPVRVLTVRLDEDLG